MPKRTDLESILILGSGPIVIGQACEFDYSGTQAVRALKEEGYRVILVNSNPATIMTDPDLADRTYIEPLTPEWVTRVIEREKPDALLPTMGGQTALNLAMDLDRMGVLKENGVELIGANARRVRNLYSLDACGQRLLELYRTILEAPRASDLDPPDHPETILQSFLDVTRWRPLLA